MKRHSISFCLLFVLAVVTSCSSKQEAEKDSSSSQAAVPKVASKEVQVKPTANEVREVHAELSDDEVEISHILLMYKGGDRVPDSIARTKEEALALAKEVRAKLSSGADFAALAKEYSDCPSKYKGGELGKMQLDRLVPALAEGIKGTPIGEISDPVETPSAYHIIKRREVVPVTLLSASFIVVAYGGFKVGDQSKKRSKEDAFARAEEVLAALKSGRNFVDVVAQYSDHDTKVSGGNVGNMRDDKIDPKMATAIKALKIGEVSTEALELRSGYFIIKRQKVRKTQMLSASMILIMHRDSKPNMIGSTRSKADALARAKDVIAKIKGGEDFVVLAKQYSEHPTSAKGGMLGVFSSDKAPAVLSDAIESLKVGQVSSEPVDAPLGYHIILRHGVEQN